ncbi:MAG: ABC transporter ATP-binding protein/permease [Bacteroides sp.]|nr:ABC transporter ATP-binding protein/permease [Bacteroides sp.]MCM1549230.1 ABC transporter ATP-binding protein/permease [Clostridium sp.]
MLKIFRYMKSQWYLVLVVIALLVVQAQCDLSLPEYTSKIIDTGIQNQGMEHCVPELILAEEHQAIGLFLTAEEMADWNAIYDPKGDIYQLNIAGDSERWYQADEEFRIPILMNGNMRKMTAERLGAMMAEAVPDMTVSDTEIMIMTELQTSGTGKGPGMEVAVDLQNLVQTYEVEEEDGDGNPVTNTYMDIRGLLPVLKKMGAYTDTDVEELRCQTEEGLEAVGETMVQSMAVAYAIEAYQAAGGDIQALQQAYLLKTGGKMLALTLLMVGVAILAGFFASRIGGRIGMELRGNIFRKVVTFINREMDQFSTASLITRSTNDVQQIQMVSTMLLRMLIYAPIIGIGGVFHVLKTGAGMEWIILLAVITILVLVGALMLIAMPKFKIMQKKVDNLNLISREILTGLMVIRAFVREDTEEQRFDEANRDLTKTMLFTNRVMTFMMPAMMLIMNGISILIVWISANRIDAGVMQVGSMTAFITYTMQIVMAFLIICMFSIMLPRAGVAADRIEEVLNTEVLVKDAPDAVTLEHCEGTVEFHHVNFRYPGAEADVLEDIDFTARPGETTAIIGSTGCGKSTLIHLIPRFYDVTEGSVTIDGRDIRTLTQESLRNQIGLVPQKGVLFSGTIASNLQFGNPDADEEELQKAAEIAQAKDFIEEKSQKYESSIAQGGSNVSGGQKQRLSIARAIAKHPRIFIFDDSFSALDFKTDAALRKALHEHVTDSTVIIVAQRISTILHADQILVLDEGRIVGKGTHEELLETCEVYQQIARSQLSEQELSESRSVSAQKVAVDTAEGKEAGFHE